MSNGQCPCDVRAHPVPLAIHAGLTRIPRQIAGFPEFRRAMLAELGKQAALGPWRGRSEDDLGVMLLEMWAYVCDVLAFYDETIAHECYLRTARLRPSVRKLVDLLGYVPRPAVAASVLLAAIAEGRKPVTLPLGTAFRSQAFDGEPPQIFELDAETTIHALSNQWDITPETSGTIFVPGVNGGAEEGLAPDTETEDSLVEIARLLLDSDYTDLSEGELILLRVPERELVHAGTVTGLSKIIGADGSPYDQVEFAPAFRLPRNIRPPEIRLLRATRTALLWTMERADANDPPVFSPSAERASGSQGVSLTYGLDLVLSGLHREIIPGDQLLVAKGSEVQWFEVSSVSEHLMHALAATITTGEDESGNQIPVPVPPVLVLATRLSISAQFRDPPPDLVNPGSWGRNDPGRIVVHHGLVEAGRVAQVKRHRVYVDAGLTLTPGEGSAVPGAFEHRPILWAVEDAGGTAFVSPATLEEAGMRLVLDPGTDRPGSLVPPASVYGNLLRASRGETVVDEVLGSGDASTAGQVFQLKKKPLTYLASPTADNDRAVASTLKVWVDGILWKEASTFFGTGPDDRVYILRQTDEGHTRVIFGDSIRGRRLPSGRDNVVASYRFGAGAKAPPAGGITQIAKPVKGLKSIRSPLSAGGGADADSAEHIRANAPASALLLGRAVSIRDFEAAAAGMAGVRAVSADWRWDGVRQGAVVKVWYIGDPGIEAKLCASLRNRADPTVTIDVERATAQPLDLTLSIELNPDYREADVFAAVRAALLDAESGLLAPANIGIGQPLYRSRLFERVLAVEGTVAVTRVTYMRRMALVIPPYAKKTNWVRSFDSIALQPGAGRYFDLEETGSLTLNRREHADG